jgi:hypothetical protein
MMDYFKSAWLKSLYALLATLFITLSFNSFAAEPTTTQAGADQQAAIGKVLAVKGTVEAIHDGSARALKRGSEFYKNDTIETKDSATARLRFTDDSLLNLAAKSKFVVSKYDFNPASPSSDSFAAQLFKGGMKTATGNIARANKNGYRVIAGANAQKPVAIIGVRGTKYTVSVLDENLILRVFEGSVSATINGRTRAISQGNQLTISGNQIAKTPFTRGVNTFNMKTDAQVTTEESTVTEAASTERPSTVEASTTVSGEAAEYGDIADENGEIQASDEFTSEQLQASADVAELNEATSNPIHVFAIQDGNNALASSSENMIHVVAFDSNSGEFIGIYQIRSP